MKAQLSCDDLLSDLVTAEVDGQTLDDDHLYGFLRLLIPAGAETTFRMFGNSLVGLLTHPDALAEVKKGIQEGEEVVLNPETVAEKSGAVEMP